MSKLLATRTLVFAALATVATAQDYWTPERIEEQRLADAALSGLTEALDPSPLGAANTGGAVAFTAFDPLAQLLEEATFLTVHQVKGGPNKGGMKEGEALATIVQTDNTTESIWVWSRYRELTGDTRFDNNVASAWGYLLANPAWQEEGGGGLNGYYRIYNCAWGVIAEPKYRAATGDTTYLTYSTMCASYLNSHFLNVSPVNTMIKGFAAGALYEFGLEQNNPTYVARALQLGDKARETVEADPALLSQEAWAMSGGAIMWGVLNSTFRANPGGRAWAETYAPMMKEWDTGGTWHFAHNGWYALGHDAAWDVTADEAHWRTQYEIQLRLLSKDTDDDGGIPTQKTNFSFEDETWVSNYLIYMGTEKVRERVDVAAASDDFAIAPGSPWTVDVTLASQDPVNVLMSTVQLELSGPGLGPIPIIAPRTLVLAPLGVTPTYAYSVPLGTNPAPGTYTVKFSGATAVEGVVETASVSVLVQ